MINKLINELVSYGISNHLIDPVDEVYTVNRLLELLQLSEYQPETDLESVRPVNEILEDIMAYAFENGIMKEDTTTAKDLFDTKIMGILTPPPSQVQKTFNELYESSPKKATDYYYDFSKATNYIRVDRIAKDEKWVTETEYGPIDITINLSKPEKDPRDIAKAGQAKKSGYPSCLLCRENEGYEGNFNHPARQNHRIIPMILNEEDYYLQYSPYVYYNEHCIIFNKEHTPMKINKSTFVKLLDFVKQFPHYTAGSNADLPIVGGSILSHDHFQGGNYVFAMAKAPYERYVKMDKYPTVTAGVIRWPMSVIRLSGKDIYEIAEAGDHILKCWKEYSDPEAFIFRDTDGVPHNTITPIARQKDGVYELDLVLRNNITTEEHPMGVYHPHAQYHHIKKENIGLIEVMGLAVLPARLKKEMLQLEEAILNHKNLREDETLEKHADWAEKWSSEREITPENVHDVIREEIGKVFAKVLECAGVYKRTEDGQAAFDRFLKVISE